MLPLWLIAFLLTKGRLRKQASTEVSASRGDLNNYFTYNHLKRQTHKMITVLVQLSH